MSEVTKTAAHKDFYPIRRAKVTYAEWITKAIASSPHNCLALAEINDWMVANVPGLKNLRFLHSSQGWKNAVRHTLSVNRSRFVKISREGRPSLWTLNAKYRRSLPFESICRSISANNYKHGSCFPNDNAIEFESNRDEPTKHALNSESMVPSEHSYPQLNLEISALIAQNRAIHLLSLADEYAERNSLLNHQLSSAASFPSNNNGMFIPQLATQSVQVMFQDGSIGSMPIPRPLPLSDASVLISDFSNQCSNFWWSNSKKSERLLTSDINHQFCMEMAKFLLMQGHINRNESISASPIL